MADPDDEDGYSDAELDALQSEDFLELEQNALQSTQRSYAAANQNQFQLPVHVAPPQTEAFNAASRLQQTRQQQAQPPSSDYGDFDDDLLLDGEVVNYPSEVGVNRFVGDAGVGDNVQRAEWRQEPYLKPPTSKIRTWPQDIFHSRSTSELPRRPKVQVQPSVYQDDGELMLNDLGAQEKGQGQAVDSVDALKVKVAQLLREREALEQERENLRQAAKAANDQVLAKAGEVAIVRANQAKTVKECQAKVQALEKLHAETVARQKIELDSTRAERERIATENKFLRRDVIEESERARQAQKVAKVTTGGPAAQNGEPITTPKKNKIPSYRDGFDDDEIVAISPSKVIGKQKALTPKFGIKRKRKANEDSPGQPLQLSQPKGANSGDSFMEAAQGLTKQVPITITPAPKEDQRYQYQPIRILMDLVKFIILIAPVTTSPRLLDDLVALLQVTADVNVLARFKREPAQISPLIDATECLDVLLLIASSCVRVREDIERFWGCIRFDFILMVLRSCQPIEDIKLMISLLRTSCLEDSFAMRVRPEEGIQSISETYVIERISGILIETPKPTESEQRPYDTVEISALRLDTLALIEKMCDDNYGGQALARHPMAIGRLVRLMNDELHALYQYKPGHEYRTELINQATRILFHLTSTFSDLINMQEKLQAEIGGANRWLIALTRLAFSEGIFYEQGIEDDVVDCAHQMLENSVTPEEGEALLEAFSSSSKRS